MNLRLKRYIDAMVRKAVAKRFHIDSLWTDIVSKITDIVNKFNTGGIVKYGSEARRASERVAKQLASASSLITGLKKKIPVAVGQGHWPAGWSNANVYKEVKVSMDDIISKVVNAAKTLAAKEQDFASHDGTDFYNSLKNSIGPLISSLNQARNEMPAPGNIESIRNKKFSTTEEERNAERRAKLVKRNKATAVVRKK